MLHPDAADAEAMKLLELRVRHIGPQHHDPPQPIRSSLQRLDQRHIVKTVDARLNHDAFGNPHRVREGEPTPRDAMIAGV